MTDPWDLDISALDLSDVEKNGLQVFRNYSTAFEKHRAKEFVKELNKLEISLSELSSVLNLIVGEEGRTLPIVSCAFADDQLKSMFLREIPKEIPGGRSTLFSGFGSLSTLSQRIQVAYAFNWLAEDVLEELSHLRKLRNDIAHKWDISFLEEKLKLLINDKQLPIEKFIDDGTRLPTNFSSRLTPIGKFRTRLVWVLGRVFYETNFWVPVLKKKLTPIQVLYGEGSPDLLGKVSRLCVKATNEIIDKNEI